MRINMRCNEMRMGKTVRLDVTLDESDEAKPY